MRRGTRLATVCATALLVLASCSGEPGDGGPQHETRGADSPEEAVTELVGHLAGGDFPAAAPLAIPGQAALASLAEGATIADVAAGLRDGDSMIAANFWSGFAQSVEPWLTEGVEVVDTTQETTESVAFDLVRVRSVAEPERQIATQDVEGYRIDILATFGPSLASRLYPQVERLFGSEDPDAEFVLGAMRDHVPSLHLAAVTPGLAPNVVQDILQLIELITRAS